MVSAAGSNICVSDLIRTVVVTGASGFIGRNVIRTLSAAGWRVRAIYRRPPEPSVEIEGVEQFVVGEIGPATSWGLALHGVDAVLHCAAVAHVDESRAQNMQDEFIRVNVEGTRCLIEASINAQVKRFVFLSSIGVNGNRTTEKPFLPTDSPNPQQFYARSKMIAEEIVKSLCGSGGMEYVIVRPCLVFGPGAPGNVARLTRLVKAGIPLPFGALKNKRSLISVDALTQLLEIVCVHPNAADKIFLAAESPALSLGEIIFALSRGMGKRPVIFNVPGWILRVTATILGRGTDIKKLCDSLEVDASQTEELLCWRTTVSLLDRLADVGAKAQSSVE